MYQRRSLIRAFQIIGACAVMVYCLVRIAQDSRLRQTDVVYQPRRYNSKISYLERWQEEVVYGIFIIMCGSLVVYALKSDGVKDENCDDKRRDI